MTARQREVVRAYAITGTYRGAADRLGITVDTVGHHLAEVRHRLCVETTVQAVFLLTADGMITRIDKP